VEEFFPRRYPSRPIVGVGAVIFIDGRVLLVKRGHEPLAGSWSLPGGTVELGETAAAAVVREIREETGLVVEVGPVVEVVDRIQVEDNGRVGYHFVVIDYLCRSRAGKLVAGSDVADVALADPAALDPYGLTEAVQAVIARAASGIG
jgi:8-oxo-dGTP diphosphatase